MRVIFAQVEPFIGKEKKTGQDDLSNTRGKEPTMSKVFMTLIISLTIYFHVTKQGTVIAQEYIRVTTVRPVLPDLPVGHATGATGSVKTLRHPVFRLVQPSLARPSKLSLKSSANRPNSGPPVFRSTKPFTTSDPPPPFYRWISEKQQSTCNSRFESRHLPVQSETTLWQEATK